MIVEMLKQGEYLPSPFKVMTKEEKRFEFLRQRERDRQYRKMIEQESKKYYRFHRKNGSKMYKSVIRVSKSKNRGKPKKLT